MIMLSLSFDTRLVNESNHRELLSKYYCTNKGSESTKDIIITTAIPLSNTTNVSTEESTTAPTVSSTTATVPANTSGRIKTS